MAQRQQETITIPEGATLFLNVDDGDLRITGGPAGKAAVSSRSGLQVQSNGERVDVRGHDTLEVLVPAGTPVVVEGSCKSLMARHLVGSLTVAHVEDDVVLRHLGGEVILEQCDGDLTAEHLASLRVTGSVSGDVSLRHVGHFEAETIDDDLSGAEVGRVAVRQCHALSLARVGEVEVDNAEDDVSLSHVSGRARFQHIQGDLTIAVVGGAVTLGDVEGDVKLARVSGEMTASSIGGDVSLTQIEGNIALEQVQGNLQVVFFGSSLLASQVQGDVMLQGQATPGVEIRLQAEGDVVANLAGDIAYEVKAEGDLRYPPGTTTIEHSGEGRFVGRVGQGENPASVSIQASGDVILGQGHRHHRRGRRFDFEGFGRDLEHQLRDVMRQVEREVEGAISQAMRGLEEVNVVLNQPWGMPPEPPRAPEPPQRPWHPEQPQRPSHPEHPRRPERPWREALNSWLRQVSEEGERAAPAPSRADLGEETMIILRMVQNGTISPEEAAKLLEAMGG